MDPHWFALAFALLLTTLAVAGLVRPPRLLQDNVAWFACGWLGSEFAPALLVLSLATLALLAGPAESLHGDSGRLAGLLLAGASLGFGLTWRRAAGSQPTLEEGLTRALGPAWLGEIPAARIAAVTARPSARARVLAYPRRPRVVELIPDLRYPGGHQRNALDVYRLRGGCREAPVMLFLHGGDWVGGHKRQQSLPMLHHLAAQGWLVAAPNYRLGPQSRMPAALVDCKAAFAWLRARAESLGGDPSFIAVAGSGAGAHLASLLALSFDDDSLQPGFEHVDTRPAACVALNGVYDLADRHGRHFGRRARLRWLASHVMSGPLAREDARSWEFASPVARVRDDAPPFLVLHGAHDVLSPADEAREFVSRLRTVATSPVAHAELPGAPHGWDSACTTRTDATVQAVTLFLEWCVARHVAERGMLRDRAGGRALR
jgi:acetyl esterase/lipase